MHYFFYKKYYINKKNPIEMCEHVHIYLIYTWESTILFYMCRYGKREREREQCLNKYHTENSTFLISNNGQIYMLQYGMCPKRYKRQNIQNTCTF